MDPDESSPTQATPLAPETARGLAGALSDFGFALQRRILSPRDNLVLSPVSAWLTLMALVPGSRGETRAELVKVLAGEGGGDPEELAAAASVLVRSLSHRQGRTWEEAPDTGEWREKPVDLFVLEIATAVWAAEAYPFRGEYIDVLLDAFQVGAASLDFRDPEAVADRVNAWAAERTRGRISSVLSPEAVNPLTRLLLANATYFKAAWSVRFPEENTRLAPFHVPGGTVEVDMMRSVASRGHARLEDPGLDVVALSYDAMEALVIVPELGDLVAVEGALSADFVRGLWTGLVERDVTLELPRFDLGSSLALHDVLPDLGVRLALSEGADFRGMSPHPEGLYLSGVIHEARIRVDEEGTEAAAVTVAAMAGLALPDEEPEPVTVVVDRPFIFLVWDPQTGAVLFTARVTDPTSSG